MPKTLILAIFVFLFSVLKSGLIYAKDDDCTRTVTCSDGTKLITTRCSYSYSIIDGKPVGDYPHDDDHRHHKHPKGDDPDDKGDGHGDGPDDPCLNGHGYRVDNDSDAIVAPAVSDSPSVTDAPEDPYNLMHGHHRVYDPDDPYGLRQVRHQGNDEE